MPTGLQLFKPNGSLQLDMTQRVMKMLGVANTGGAASGSIYVAEWGTEQGWYVPLLGVGATTSTVPTIRKSGTTLSWSFPPPNAGQPIVYGVM